VSRVDSSERLFAGLFTLAAARVRPDELRHATSCMAVVRELNARSQRGRQWDPHVTVADIVGILRTLDGIGSPEAESELVLVELERVVLILVSQPEVGPSEDFFAMTDAFFQPWNPKDDARALLRYGQEFEGDRIHLDQADAKLRFGPRRMNAYRLSEGP
jgi:hypothetical protein